MKLKILSIFLLGILLAACEDGRFLANDRGRKQDATIHYFITTSSESPFTEISFQFSYARAHKSQLNQIRTVYLNPTEVNVDLGNPEKVYLGSSTIEPELITGYDFGLGNFSVETGSETLDLNLLGFNFYTDFHLEPMEGEELEVTFVLDMDESIRLDSAGQNWIKPKFKVQE